MEKTLSKCFFGSVQIISRFDSQVGSRSLHYFQELSRSSNMALLHFANPFEVL